MDTRQQLTHFDAQGRAVMVDVSAKPHTARLAVAVGRIAMNEAAFAAVNAGQSSKGDVLGVARVAGIMATKRCAELIPLCHPVPTDHAAVEFTALPECLSIEARCSVSCTGQTGVEMEALCGVSVALLTVYDMLKALDKAMCIADVRLLHKSGGKSGVFHAHA